MVGVSWESQDTPIWRVVISDHITMILGWSEYPGSPWILRQGGDSPPQDDPVMVGVSQESQDTPTWDIWDKGGGKLCPYHDDPGLVGVSWESQDTQTGGSELYPPRDDPVLVGVSRESQGTQTEGGELRMSLKYRYPYMGGQRPSWDDLDVAECLGNPKILRQGEWVDCVHPRMMLGWPECPENPRILRRGSELYPSQDDPGMVEVSRESQDTHIWAGGGVSSVHPRMIKKWLNYPGNPRILKQGWVGGLSIPG